MVLFFTYLIAALILALYVGWVVMRYRREQRNKAMEAERRTPPSAAALLDRDRIVSPPPSAAPSASPSSPPSTASPAPSVPPVPATPATSSPPARTVAEALSGIAMPQDLVPFTAIAPRSGVVDHVAFSSKLPVDVVGPAFADELERLGYAVTPLDEGTLAAKRGNDALIVHIDPQPSAPAPEGSVVLEVCVPY